MAVWQRFAQALLSWGPQGIFVLSILDSAGVPVVGGVDALLIAFAVDDPGQAYLAAVCAILGSVAGSLILFAIARKGGEVLLSKHISSRTGARLHLWFQRYGLVTVFIPALSPLPMPMKIPVFCAGALQVRPAYFIAVVVCGANDPLFRTGVFGSSLRPSDFPIFAFTRGACRGDGTGIGDNIGRRSAAGAAARGCQGNTRVMNRPAV